MASGQLMRKPAGKDTVGEPSDRQLLERFTKRRDEAAFESLVRRHGPMVLGVCRRILGNLDDADDAFQATFLVLARRAREVGQPELLGNWLYGVAYRISLKAKGQASRRSQCEKQAATMHAGNHSAEGDQHELRVFLAEEIERLPEKYRAPVVLCYLEGKTNEQAAGEIGCPVGSMSWRLARARDILRQRLKHFGVMVPVGKMAPLLAGQTGPAAVPEVLLETTIEVAVRGAASLGTGSAAVTKLAEAALRDLSAPRSYRRLAVLAALLLLAIGGSGALAYGAHAWQNWLASPISPPTPVQPAPTVAPTVVTTSTAGGACH